MKRGNYEGGPSPGAATAASKRHRGDKFEVRLLVPSKCAGSIIGKGGQNIQKLRTEFNANIRVPDCPGPERVMTIHCDTPDVVANVLEQTIPLLCEDPGARNGGANPTGNVKPPEQAGVDGLEARLLIHQSIVGGIIGRAGFKIKEIRDSSGANIKVYQTCAPQSTDRCVAVQGALAKIIMALKEVFDIINNTEIKGPDQPYDPINFDGYYSCEYGGFGTELDVYGAGPGGRGGTGGRAGPGGGRGGGGGAGRMPSGGAPPGGMNGGYMGGPGGFNGPPRAGRGGRGGGNFDHEGGGRFGGHRQQRGQGYDYNIDVANYTKNNSNNFNAGNDQSNQGAPPQFNNMQDDNGEQESTQVTIPKDMAGAIIGPGGSRIRKIRSDSKANITIDEPVQGSNERIITIAGTQRQIQTAQYLLQQSVREHAGPPPMPYGGPPVRY